MSIFSSQSCAEFNSQTCSGGKAKRPKEGDYDEIVAKSKPVRKLVSRSCVEPLATPFSTVFSRPGNFGYEDHDRFQENAG